MMIALPAPYDLTRAGGVERYILSLAKALMKKHEVIIYSDSNPGSPFVVRPLNQAPKDQADLVITQAIYGQCPKPDSKKRVHIYHGTILGNWIARPWLLLHRKFWSWFLMEKSSYTGLSGVVTVSRQAMREVRLMGYTGPIHLVHSGGGFSDELGIAKKEHTNQKLALFCGRPMDKVKRFDWIEKAVKEARFLGSSWKLLVLGDFGNRSEDEAVIPLGSLPHFEVLQCLKRADLQINASYYEGCSLALAEGMYYASLPALATRVGGNKDQILPNQNGDFFKSPIDLAQKLVALEKNPAILQSWRSFLETQCRVPSWEDVAQSILDFSETLGESQC